MRFRSLVISLGMLGLLVAPAGLAAQEDLHSPRYTVIELGTLAQLPHFSVPDPVFSIT